MDKQTTKGRNDVQHRQTGMTITQIVGFAVLGGILLLGTEFESTSDISVAFAFLLFFAVLGMAGPDAVGNLQKAMGQTQTIGSKK